MTTREGTVTLSVARGGEERREGKGGSAKDSPPRIKCHCGSPMVNHDEETVQGKGKGKGKGKKGEGRGERGLRGASEECGRRGRKVEKVLG